MKKTLFFATLFLLSSSFIISQAIGGGTLNFKRVLDTPYPKHSGTAGGDLVVADLNGDTKDDIIVTGLQSTSFITNIYFQKADGSGFDNPVRTEHGLPALDRGAVLRTADMDSDGDLDVVLYGRTGVAMQTSLFQVYSNNGKGIFTKAADLGINLPSEDFEDVPGAWGKAANAEDNLSDKDVKGLYNAMGWSKGILELIDLNNDGKLDIVFAGTKGIESGTDPAGQMIQRDWETSGVFLNNGNNKFTYLTTKDHPAAGIPENPEKEPARCYSGIAKLSRGFSASADFNGDKIMDIVVFGQANIGSKANAGIPETQRNGQPVAEVYLGKGDGTFTIIKNCGLPALIDGSALAVDLNKDGKKDLVIMGNTGYTKDPAGGRVTQIFTGNGDGTFKLDTKQNYDKIPNSADWIVPMMSGDICAGDFDSDGDTDLAMTGNSNDKALYLYLNQDGKYSILDLDRMKNGLGSNNLIGNAEADASTESDISAIDFDHDGDIDIVLNGRGGAFQLLAFKNLLIP